MWLSWKRLVALNAVMVAVTFVSVLPGDATADAQGPPPTCYATVTGFNFPGAPTTGPTQNGKFYTYTWNWTVNFTCGDGGPTACYICETVYGAYTTNDWQTWTNFDDGSSSVQPQTCGKGYQCTYTTTVNTVPGALYNITFAYNAFSPSPQCPSCGSCGYLAAKQLVNFAVPC